MKDFIVSVTKLTDEHLMRQACECTFRGTSQQSLVSIYKSEHSPVRTQMFWIKLENIPLFVSTHLIRHHVGSIPFQLTCRDDRQGGNVGFTEKMDGVINRLRNIVEGGSTYDRTELLLIMADSIKELEWLKENADRQTPVTLGLCVNAQSLIDMAKMRLCNCAHRNTIEVFTAIKEKIAEIDPALASMMVRKCVYRNGLCGEPRCCGFNATPAFTEELHRYRQNFSNRQMGIKTKLQ